MPFDNRFFLPSDRSHHSDGIALPIYWSKKTKKRTYSIQYVGRLANHVQMRNLRSASKVSGHHPRALASFSIR